MVEGEFAKIRKEAAKEAERNIISKLLVNHSLGEVSKLIGMESSEILAILQK